mmetsp:Transcript_9426/g.25574  ORF Transcript_9426/g.25574 Transcript_9426/m.25574 type:complete len:110 (-) Transcript_9426:2630-2959(-)
MEAKVHTWKEGDRGRKTILCLLLTHIRTAMNTHLFLMHSLFACHNTTPTVVTLQTIPAAKPTPIRIRKLLYMSHMRGERDMDTDTNTNTAMIMKSARERMTKGVSTRSA